MQTMYTALRPWARASPFVLTQQKIDAFAVHLAECGRAPLTVETYRHWLEVLQKLLPGGKITPETPQMLQKQLLEHGYAPRSVNVALTALNSLLKSHNLWLPPQRLAEPPANTARLTADEVQRLLDAAQGDERIYLIINLFAFAGLTPKDLPQLTAEKIGETTNISPRLRVKLLRYAENTNRHTGPLFVGGDSRPLHRTQVTRLIQRVAAAAQVEQERATPRGLHQFYIQNLLIMTKITYEMEERIPC